MQLNYSEDLIAIKGVTWDCKGLKAQMVETLLQSSLMWQLEGSCGCLHKATSQDNWFPPEQVTRESTQDRSHCLFITNC